MGTGVSKDMESMNSRDWNGAGKVAIVTGPTGSGIGFHTARWLAERGCHVVLAGRNAERLQTCAKEIREASKAADGSPLKGEDLHLTEIPLDLGSLQSVEEFATKFQALNLPLHILVNNAGIMMTPYGHSADGFEQQMGTNHVGHFHLTSLLMPQLRAAGAQDPASPARVVNVASMGHQFANMTTDNLRTNVLHPTPKQYTSYVAYGNSKLANMLMAKELQKRHGGEGIAAFSLHPGVVATDLGRQSFGMRMFYWLGAVAMKSSLEGTGTSVFCATHPDALQHRGAYFDRCAVASDAARPTFRDDKLAEALWDTTVEEIKAAKAKREQQKQEPKQEQKQEQHPA